MINEKLKTLIILDAEKNYTKTAQLCNLTQPAITQHIKALEEHYNIKIFKRVQGKLVTTPEGQILVRNAKRLIGMNKNIEKEIFSSITNKQSYDIGITLTASYYLIPEILNMIKVKHPGVFINFHTDIIVNIVERLKFLELDFAIVDGEIPPSNLVSHLLTKDELILIVSKDHPFVEYDEVTWDMIKGERLILRHKNANTRDQIENYLISIGDNLNNYQVILEIDNSSLIRRLVRDGHGISFVSKSICVSDLETGALKEIKIQDYHLERGVYLVHQKKSKNRNIIKDILSLSDYT